MLVYKWDDAHQYANATPQMRYIHCMAACGPLSLATMVVSAMYVGTVAE